MPGRLKIKITNFSEALKIVNEKKEIFSANVKGHIDSNF
jgi:hypothetical protein